MKWNWRLKTEKIKCSQIDATHDCAIYDYVITNDVEIVARKVLWYSHEGCRSRNMATRWKAVVPKSYRLEGQPRSTRNEYPIRSAFGNSRQIQYGDLWAFFLSLRSNVSKGQSTRRGRKGSMFYSLYQFEILLYELLELLLSSIYSITFVKLIAYTNYNL